MLHHSYHFHLALITNLSFLQVHCSPLGHADSQPYPSEEIVHQFFKEVFLKTKNTENVDKLSEGLGKTIFDMLIVKVVTKQHWCLIRMWLPRTPKVEVDNGLVAVHCAHGLNRWGVCLSSKIADYFCLIGWNLSLTISLIFFLMLTISVKLSLTISWKILL